MVHDTINVFKSLEEFDDMFDEIKKLQDITLDKYKMDKVQSTKLLKRLLVLEEECIKLKQEFLEESEEYGR
jgi:hypothetical protein